MTSVMWNYTINSATGEKENNKCVDVDRISELMDDILILILSLLEIREAARTSLLSRRWRYLWTDLTSLDFDASNYMLEQGRGMHYKLNEEERARCLCWVNQIVSLHRAQVMDKFRVFLCLGNDGRECADDVNKWIKFAISKRLVKHLELDFVCSRHYWGHYTLGWDVIKELPCDSGITSLHFGRVNISGQLLELFLSRCHNLKRLFIEDSNELVNFEVKPSSSCRLRCLTVRHCRYLQSIKICALNLVSFEFICACDIPIKMIYNGVPSLVEASFGGYYFSSSPNIWEIPIFYTQLCKLSLELEVDLLPTKVPTFHNVKHLELIAHVDHDNLLVFRCVIEACPLLHELKLEFYWACCCYSNDSSDDDEEYPSPEEVTQWLETTEDMSNYAFPNLRVFEWVDNDGLDHVTDIMLVLYIVKNAPRLDKLLCNSNLTYQDPYNTLNELNYRGFEDSRYRFQQLAMIIPSKVHVVIL